jgi:outer membrane protein assembly factor BamB
VVANGIVFCAGGSSIVAFDPVTGKEKWRNSDLGTIHWQSPIVVNGILYITDNSDQVTAFSLTAQGS